MRHLLEQNTTETPVVDREGISLATQCLDGHVVGRPNDRVSIARIRHPDRFVNRLHLHG